MQDYLKQRSKNKIEFSIDRGLSTKLPPIKDKKLIDPENDLELQNLQEGTENTQIDTDSEKVFLKELFDRAFELSSKHLLEQKNVIEPAMGNDNANVCVDLYHSGTNNACLAFGLSLKKSDSPQKGVKLPIIVNEYVGNIGSLNFEDPENAKFAKTFQSILEAAFKCFGKRYNQLNKEEMKVQNNAGFKIVDKQQFAAIRLDNSEHEIIADVIITNLIKYILKIFDPNVLNKKIRELCITFPSDFDTAQRTLLRECLSRLSIKKCNLITKPIAIAAPILIEKQDDNKKTILIDFSSGYLSNTIMAKSEKRLIIKDRMIRKKISTENLIKNLISTATLELQKNGISSINTLKIRVEIEKALNSLNEKLENPENKIDNVQDTIEVEIDGIKIELNIKKFDGEKLAIEIENALQESEFGLKNDENFRLILNVNPIVAKFLIPRINQLYPNVELTLRPSEYSAAYGGVVLAQQAKYGIETSDLLPYSVGICLYNGLMIKLINGKSNYPCSGNHVFQTVVDNQKTIRVIAYEGDRILSRNCKPIGELVAYNIPPAPAGQIQCQITLKFDTNGVLTPIAYDVENKRNFNIELNPNPQLLNVKKTGDGLNLNANADTDEDRKLHAALDSLDLLMSLLIQISKEIPKQNKDEVLLKIKRAKNYINIHKNDITAEDCEQIQLELEECADENNLDRRKSIAIPASQVFNSTKASKVNDTDKNEAKTCCIM